MEDSRHLQEKQKKKRSTEGSQMKKDGKKKSHDGMKIGSLPGTIQHHPDQHGTSVHQTDLQLPDRLVPDQARLHNVPPKKSLSPSFLASLTSSSTQESSFQPQEQLYTVQHHPTSQSSIPTTRGPPDVRFMNQMLSQNVEQVRPFSADQGGLLRQQLLQGIRPELTKSKIDLPQASSHYKPDPSQPSPLYQQTSPPPNRTVHNIPGSSPGRASIPETERASPYHVSTIRRTPSPAPRHPSPQPSQGFRQGRVSPAPGERTQLSLDEAVRLMQGHPAASVSGQFLSQLSQQQTRQQEAEDVHRHYMPRFPESFARTDFYPSSDYSLKVREPVSQKTERSTKQFISTMLAQAKSRQQQAPASQSIDSTTTGGLLQGHTIDQPTSLGSMMFTRGLTVDTEHGMSLHSSQFVRVSPGALPRQSSPASGAVQRHPSPSGGVVRHGPPAGILQRPTSGGLPRQGLTTTARQITSVGPPTSQMFQAGMVSQTQGLLQPQVSTSQSTTTRRIPSPKPQHRHKDFAQSQRKEHVSNVNISEHSIPIKQPVVELIKIPLPKSDVEKMPTFSASQMASLTSQLHQHHQVPFSHPSQSVSVTMTTEIPKPNPSNVNPFTFPSKPAAAIISQPKNQPRYEVISPVVPLVTETKRKLSDIEMPQLDPVPPLQKEPSPVKVEMVKMKNPFNMRIKNLANLPTNTMYRATYRAHSMAVHRAKAGLITSTAKTLDLLRQNLQKFINKEIDVIVKQYLDTFFKPGIDNIKNNNGENSVTDEHVQAVCRQILEEAKKMYTTDQRSTTPVREEHPSLPFSRKRNASDTDSDKSGSHLAKKLKKKGRPPIYTSGRSTPSKPAKANEPVKREGPKWDSNRLNASSQYIMGARANKALGLGATRGRIYIKHPDVFKYCGDQDDKQWLYENHKMPATGGKAYMMLLEDVKDLAEDDEYRSNPNVMMDEIVGFCIPDWMTEKVKVQMEGLRTDKAKQRSRSATPSNGQVGTQQQEGNDGMKDLPFSAFSSAKNSPQVEKEEIQTSPSADTEMEFLTAGDNVDHNNLSPFNITGGFEDGVSPSASDLDNLEEEAPLSAPFEFTK